MLRWNFKSSSGIIVRGSRQRKCPGVNAGKSEGAELMGQRGRKFKSAWT